MNKTWEHFPGIHVCKYGEKVEKERPGGTSCCSPCPVPAAPSHIPCPPLEMHGSTEPQGRAGCSRRAPTAPQGCKIEEKALSTEMLTRGSEIPTARLGTERWVMLVMVRTSAWCRRPPVPPSSPTSVPSPLPSPAAGESAPLGTPTCVTQSADAAPRVPGLGLLSRLLWEKDFLFSIPQKQIFAAPASAAPGSTGDTHGWAWGGREQNSVPCPECTLCSSSSCTCTCVCSRNLSFLQAVLQEGLSSGYSW